MTSVWNVRCKNSPRAFNLLSILAILTTSYLAHFHQTGPPEDVPILQKNIIDECRSQGKPVVVGMFVNTVLYSWLSVASSTFYSHSPPPLQQPRRCSSP